MVVLSIDQFRGDYLARFGDLFGDDGFRRIVRDGFEYRQCFYPTANTETAPGHASMLTGCYANRNGIVQNRWREAGTDGEIYCVQDSAAPVVGGGAGTGGAEAGAVDRAAREGRSPARLMAETVGDELEVATNGKSRTVSLSLKDRAAILMGGRGCDLALWFEHATGRFVTSRWYAEALPAWVESFDASKPGERWFHQPWIPLLAEDRYAARCTPDNYRAERAGDVCFQGPSLPHLLGWQSAHPDARYFESVYGSPYGNDLMLDLVETALRSDSLGLDDTVDLLTISLSANDPIGHAFGPDSWEVMDACLRTDRQVARLLKLLDGAAPGRWTLFLTSDHGVASFPELAEDRGLPGQRVSMKGLTDALEEHLRSVFVTPAGDAFLAGLDPPWAWFAPRTWSALPAGRRTALAESTSAWLCARPEIALALPASDLSTRGAGADEELRDALRQGSYPGRSGQVAFVLRPGNLPSEVDGGTGHGSPWSYDCYVPLMAVGQGIRHGATTARVEPAQIAPTVALLCGLPPPASCEVPVLPELLEDRRLGPGGR